MQKLKHPNGIRFRGYSVRPSAIFFEFREVCIDIYFLDVFLDNSSNTIKTSVFRKNIFSGVLTNYFSFTSMSYKIGLVKCLIDRAYRINNTWLGFDLDLKKVFNILKKNSYPE